MLSLYVHVPFCVRKCLYCGFYSTQYAEQAADTFLSILGKEVAGLAQDIRKDLCRTVYIGGGTPTTLSVAQIKDLASTIKASFPLMQDAEWTMEANPITVDSEKLAAMLECGVNRLSLGIQSCSNEVLQTLGRAHTAEQALIAFGLARSAGFRNIGIDLIYGVPGQTMQQWEGSLQQATLLKPEHISAYCLSLDEGSSYYLGAKAGKLSLPDDELVAQMYEQACRTLHAAGYARYEISNFSRPGFACKHNLNYWERGAYIGLGPGASSCVGNRRYANVADLQEYEQRLLNGLSPIGIEEVITNEDAAREAVMLGLRMSAGIDLHRFEQEHGSVILQQLERNFTPLIAEGLLLCAEGCLKLTERGILLSDEVLARISI